jgi:hypothetical protein
MDDGVPRSSESESYQMKTLRANRVGYNPTHVMVAFEGEEKCYWVTYVGGDRLSFRPNLMQPL